MKENLEVGISVDKKIKIYSSVFSTLAKIIAGATDEERLELKERLFGDFCSGCGRYDADDPSGCQCQNDE